MFRRIIKAHNFNDILGEMEGSRETLFDFSGTNFKELGSSKLSAIFNMLSLLPHTFSLKLNYCILDEDCLENHGQLGELTLGLSATKNMETFEFVRSLSLNCREEVLIKIAESLLRNHEIKKIKIDGFRVTPPVVCDALKNHPTAVIVVVDGLLKLNREIKIDERFFKKASNDIQINLNNLKKSSNF